MKKRIIIGALGLAVVVGVSSVLAFNNGKVESTPTTVANKQTLYELTKSEINEAAKDIGELKTDKDILYAMMGMSFQKVEIGDAGFEVPGIVILHRTQMSKQNVEYLINRGEDIKIPQKAQSILTRWENGHFDSVDEDFEVIRGLASGVTGTEGISRKVEIRSSEDEKAYIKEFFGEKGLEIDNEQW